MAIHTLGALAIWATDFCEIDDDAADAEGAAGTATGDRVLSDDYAGGMVDSWS